MASSPTSTCTESWKNRNVSSPTTAVNSTTAPYTWNASWVRCTITFVLHKPTHMYIHIWMGMPGYHNPTLTTPASTANTTSPWSRPWAFQLWVKYIGFLAPGTTMKNSWATAASSRCATTSVHTAMTPTIHCPNAPPPITCATIVSVALSPHITRTSVLVAQVMHATTSLTPCSTTIIPDSWRTSISTPGVTRGRLDA